MLPRDVYLRRVDTEPFRQRVPHVRLSCCCVHVWLVLQGDDDNEKEKRILTLYRRECSRARIAFSGRTRCRDTSSPAEQRERASVGFLVHPLRISVRFAAYSTILGSILSLFFVFFSSVPD